MHTLIPKEEVKALVRLLAYALANSPLEAEMLAEWAYEKRDYNQAGRSIIEKYLATDVPATKKLKNEFIEKYIVCDGGFPVEEAKSIILRMPYSEFLKTPYWKSIAENVKDRDGNKCQRCGSEKRLHVHHLNYQHHGDELNHPEDLITLCSKCHKEVHDEKRTHKTL